jgi:hypothetical protein
LINTSQAICLRILIQRSYSKIGLISFTITRNLTVRTDPKISYQHRNIKLSRGQWEELLNRVNRKQLKLITFIRWHLGNGVYILNLPEVKRLKIAVGKPNKDKKKKVIY